MNKSFPFLFLIAIALIFSACKTSQKGIEGPLKKRSADFLYEQLVRQQLHADWLSAKARIGYEDESQRVSASATLHLRKDSLIWIAVRKLGFEVARVKVTPDSVFVLDRINNEYAAEDLQYVTQAFRFPANFEILQAMILGHPLFFRSDGFVAELGPQTYVLRQQDQTVESAYKLNGRDYTMEHMAIFDKREQRQLGVAYDRYEPLGERAQKFSYLRNIEVSTRDLGQIKMDVSFAQVEINQPQRLRFSIPERYTRVR